MDPLLLLPDSDTNFVEAVGHDRTHGDKIVYRTEASGRDVTLDVGLVIDGALEELRGRFGVRSSGLES